MASDGRWYPPELHPAARPAPPPPAVLPATDRPRLWPSIATLILGASCVILGLALFFVTVVSGILHTTAYDTPAHISLQCHAGDYLVYQSNGTNDSAPAFGVGQSGPLTITPGQVKVTGPGGNRVPTWQGTGSETITRDSQTFSSVVGFNAPEAGTYSVTVESAAPTSVIIAPSLGSQFAHGAPWLILSGLGTLIAVLGLVLLIVKANRRTRARLQAVEAGAPWRSVA
jgi:hypothetical protein